MHHYAHLSLLEREELSRGLAAGMSLRRIAHSLQRDVSTISREIARTSWGTREDYRAVKWHRAARQRARIPRCPRKLLTNAALWAQVVEKLRLRWSPEQIAAHLKRQYPDDVTQHASHETIYAALYVLPRGTLRTELLSLLRQGHRRRRKRSLLTRDRRGKISNLVSIHDRPLDVETRTVPGHWEGDLIVGKAHASAIGSLVERMTRTTVLVRIPALDTTSVRRAFERALTQLPARVRRSLTYDRGVEMHQHELLTKHVKLQVYFCDPHSPWQRGTNENTNGLVRQYYPKGTDFRPVTQRELNRVARQLNTRPRKVLDWRTPLEAWEQILDPAGVALGA